MAYVYRHIRLDTMQPFYIGKGSDENGLYKRANTKISRNNYWNKIIEKTNYRVDILLDNLTNFEAFEKEIEFIKIYGRVNIGTGILCNMTDGGEGSLNIGDETRKKLSLASKGRKHKIESIEKMRIAQIKPPMSKEVKEKLRQSHLNLSQEKRNNQNAGRHSFHISAFDIKTNDKIGDFESVNKCANHLKISASTVSRYIRGVSKNPLKFYFKVTKKT
jgi:hypothetical protein